MVGITKEEPKVDTTLSAKELSIVDEMVANMDKELDQKRYAYAEIEEKYGDDQDAINDAKDILADKFELEQNKRNLRAVETAADEAINAVTSAPMTPEMNKAVDEAMEIINEDLGGEAETLTTEEQKAVNDAVAAMDKELAPQREAAL